MTINEMKALKKELGYSYEKIAELSNLPVGTVQKVLSGITKTPRYDTLRALESAFLPDVVRESMNYGVKKVQGEFTVEDYLGFPEDERMELIDGVFYVMYAPTDKHQIIRDEIYGYFRNHIRKNKGKCLTITSPLDVQLDCDNKTMVQPDVVIVCDRSKFQNGRVFGAPDLAVEVLSKSTRKKDIFIKGNKYSEAGVKEYWIVDPEKKRVYAYLFDVDEFPIVYTFEDKVPVGIWNNECVVDFAEIYDYISFLYEQEN